MADYSTLASRRAFLRFMAASPALVGARDVMGQNLSLSDLIAPQAVTDPSEAVNVFDFLEVAKQKLWPAFPGHYTYMAVGTDGSGTMRANEEGFKKIQLRMRRLVDVRNIDMSIELLGRRYPSPILIAPVGGTKGLHPEGDVAVARAAKTRDVEQMLS